jgi:hypothetical protein
LLLGDEENYFVKKREQNKGNFTFLQKSPRLTLAHTAYLNILKIFLPLNCKTSSRKTTKVLKKSQFPYARKKE